MKINKLIICLLIPLFFLTSNCKNPFRYTDAREVPVNAKDRVRKNLEEGRGIQFGIGRGKGSGGVFDFASANELWRASIEILDFVSFTNASYSGGILITDWFTGDVNSNDQNARELKITIRFLSNEIRADGIKVIIHEKICDKADTSKCKIQKIKSSIGNEIKLAILKKATILKKDSESKNRKKRPKGRNN